MLVEAYISLCKSQLETGRDILLDPIASASNFWVVQMMTKLISLYPSDGAYKFNFHKFDFFMICFT